MSSVTFADVVHQSISFRADLPSDALILSLIDTAWVQRLRDISQTANTRLVYMFSEHSRFGHSLGVAYLASMMMDALNTDFSKEITPYRAAVGAAALLHDLGHLAPGSHTAFKSWFPGQADEHEHISTEIIAEDEEINDLLSAFGKELPELVTKILREDPSLPPWTWQMISGGGWNVDRGNWCIVDSIMAGVSYGHYNIPALIDSIMLTPENNLALRESRIDAMMHFAVSRHAMYRQVYQHRVILAADTLSRALIQRARDIADGPEFCDPTMRCALRAARVSDLNLSNIFRMREPWWRYHVMQWSESADPILADLSKRYLHRKLFKTIRVTDQENLAELLDEARRAVESLGYDPTYYLHSVSTVDVHEGDNRQSMLLKLEDGRIRTLGDSDPLFHSLVNQSDSYRRTWLVLPDEAKRKMGRIR